MAGNTAGGKAAAITNKAKYGEDFYGRIGRKGGMNGKTGGFYANRELASICGQVGGTISRRNGHKLSAREKREIKRSYEKLMAIHLKAQQERQKVLV